MVRAWVSSAVILLLAAGAAFGQAQRGNIEVTVTNAEGEAIPGATVNAVSQETLTRRTVLTDSNGNATLVSLDPARNYVVTVSLEGYATQTIEQVAVRAGQTQTLDVTLELVEVREEMVVMAETPLVDVSKTQAGQDITLNLTESRPTARSYQDYLQLVPGVQDALGTTDNPASRSGVNYRDVDGSEGDVGRSTDNLYYFDGINVTDRTSGTAGANLNTEIIQEQSVLTGAIPAEFVGVPGLISNVVTKSGGNQFSGSVNYYFQDDSLVEDNDHFEDETFSTFDTAFTFGGPIVRDRAWFFTSFRRVERDQDVVSPEGEFLRSPTRQEDQGFAKLTWAITNSDVVTGTYLSDPLEQDGDFDRTRPNQADLIREFGGDRYTLGYNRVWGSAAFELAATDHETDLDRTAKIREPANIVSFAPGTDFTSDEERLGGFGSDIFITRANEAQRASLEYLFDTGWGDHIAKIGGRLFESELAEDIQGIGDPPVDDYVSLDPIGRAITLDEVVSGYSTVEFGQSPDETQGLTENLTAAQKATLLAEWDDNGNGVLDHQEIVDNMTFSSTAGNPNGLINYTRDLQVEEGANVKGSESWAAYLQDDWQWNKWSVNAGVRAEKWDFVNSRGEDVGTFDTEIAPRISVAYDVRGDGRSSVGVFYGEYYDAFRDNAADFAGTLTGRVIHEQVYVDEVDDWVTYRFRGGDTVQDAFFAPEIETPVTEEIQLQYKQDFGRNMMAEINLIDRETSDIAEDYGSVYYNAAQYGAFGDLTHPDSLFLGPEFFGFSSLGAIPTNLNFLIATLPPEAFRDWQGVELIFRKRYSDNWQFLASYNYADAEGNSNSDSNFDGAGDVFFLDPRAPNRTGVQPGLVEHLFKLHGSYNWDMGIQVGGSYRWNSGVILNRNSGQAFSRSLPDRVDEPFPSNGLSGTTFLDTWIAPDAIGYIDGNEYGVLDLRLSYIWAINDDWKTDLFLDIFNVFDDQQVIRVQDLESGGGGFDFLEGMNFVEPRRYFLGVRLNFR